MEGQNFEKEKTIEEKLREAAKNVVGYFREKLARVLDGIEENPYFETERNF